MKVLLITPTYQYNHHYPAFVPLVLFPTGFAYLASALREAGHEVSGLNPNNIVGYSSAHTMIQDKVSQTIKETKPDLIGLGGLCTDYAFIRDAIQIIRNCSKVPIVVGGGIATHDAEYIFNLLKPDFCVIGEGEEAIVRIANGDAYDDIPNIGYWKDDKPNFTRQNFNYQDINLLPFPDYEPFNIQEMMGDYILTARWAYRYINPNPKPWILHSARNCPFSCTFCTHDGKIKYRTRSIKNVMQEIDTAYNKYHFNILIIMDELFAVNKDRLVKFCDSLSWCRNVHGWDFNWSFFTHPSASLSEDDLKMAKDAGCFFFSYGMESASPKVLKSMNKRTKLPQITEGIKLAQKVKLGFGGNFIFGDPLETEETVCETLDFAVKHCQDIDLAINAIRPYPGSKLFDDCITRGIIKDKFKYYEHIDERPWDFAYNMTSMPNKSWLPMLDSIVAFGQLYPWQKSTVPYRYKIDNESANSPVVLNTGKQVYKIWVECPHCGEEIYCRALLKSDRQTKTNSGVSFKDIGLIKDAIVKAVRLLNVYYFSFRHPIYKRLKSLVRNRGNLLWQSFFSTVFFGTGCPYCGKAVKITIPIPFTLKTFSLGEIKRRLNLSEL